jgi:hypothetical protein
MAPVQRLIGVVSRRKVRIEEKSSASGWVT